MKIEIGETKPAHYTEYWPGQYKCFSHFEYVSGVPHALFLITTLKANGKPNACFHSWSTFSGDRGGFFAVMPGLMQHTHTYQNIRREKEFCVNFLSFDYYASCGVTIRENGEDTDELAAAGLTAEPARLVKAPRIREAFLSFECTLESVTDLSGQGIAAMIIGRVRLAAMVDGHHALDAICGQPGFMFNIHSPKDPRSGEGEMSAVANLHIVKQEPG